jgi:hypothetical protein
MGGRAAGGREHGLRAELSRLVERAQGVGVVWQAFWTSRLLVWAAGVGGLLISNGAASRELSPGSDPTGSLEDVLLAPANHWDSNWFLEIAEDGYDDVLARTAFFPLYPLLVRGLGSVLPLEWAGLLISLVALFVGMRMLHRLTELELGREAADTTVLLLAFFPMSFYLSAIYSESLFFALSVGCLLLARQQRFWLAAAVGGLAAATRSQGVLLMLPLAIMLWRRRASLRQALALALVPLGLAAYLVYVRATTRLGLLAPIDSQSVWMREFRGPIVGLWGGVKNGLLGARDLVQGDPVRTPVSSVRSGLLNFAALVVGIVGVVGALRRLRLEYGAYALASLIFVISSPANALMLKSLPRFLVVVFPIFMWAGWWVSRTGHRTAAVSISAALLAAFSAAFAAGYWIA